MCRTLRDDTDVDADPCELCGVCQCDECGPCPAHVGMDDEPT